VVASNPGGNFVNGSSDISEIKKDLTEIKQAVTDGASREMIKKEIDEYLTRSALFNLGKWVILGFVILGATCWGVFSMTTLFEVASVKKQAAEIQNEMRAIDKEVTEADRIICRRIEENFLMVSEARRKAKADIDSILVAFKNDVAAGNRKLQESMIEAESSIANLENEASSRLDVDSLPDIRQLKEQIRALEASAHEVNLLNIRSFVSDWLIVLWIIGILLVLTNLGLLVFKRSRRHIV
jgi:hypothetical protein